MENLQTPYKKGAADLEIQAEVPVLTTPYLFHFSLSTSLWECEQTTLHKCFAVQITIKCHCWLLSLQTKKQSCQTFICITSFFMLLYTSQACAVAKSQLVCQTDCDKSWVCLYDWADLSCFPLKTQQFLCLKAAFLTSIELCTMNTALQ